MTSGGHPWISKRIHSLSFFTGHGLTACTVMVMYVTHRVHIMDNTTLNVYGNNYLRGIKHFFILKPVYVNVSLQCNLHATQEGRDELELKSTLTSLSLSPIIVPVESLLFGKKTDPTFHGENFVTRYVVSLQGTLNTNLRWAKAQSSMSLYKN